MVGSWLCGPVVGAFRYLDIKVAGWFLVEDVWLVEAVWVLFFYALIELGEGKW